MRSWNAIPAKTRLAARALARRPGLSLLAIMTRGLGIGANTAILSVINVVLLKPLPFCTPRDASEHSPADVAPSQVICDRLAS